MSMRLSQLGLTNHSMATGSGNVYIYSSFTNWRPRPLTVNEDTEIYGYLDYVPPGNHFFVLSLKSSVMLTDRVAEYLNRMFVKPRDVEPPACVLPKRGLLFRRRRFVKKDSIFRDFVEDDADILKKMMEADMRNNKATKLTKSKDEFEDLKYRIGRYYEGLKNSYIYYLAYYYKDYPGISQLDFGHMCRAAKILDDMKTSDIDYAFFAADGSDSKEHSFNPNRKLIRFEFMEGLIRLSQLHFRDLTQTIPAGPLFVRFMEEIIGVSLKTAQEEIEDFRHKEVYTLGVADCLELNKEMLEKVKLRVIDHQRCD